MSDGSAVLSSHIDSEAIITIVGVAPAERTDVGAIRADTKNLILEFAEKTQTPGGAAVPLSLESEVFVALSASAHCFVFPVSGPLADIGTPNRLRAASHLLRSAT
jgi:NDP-sugar pyrophosphorylase family protein